MNSRAFRAEAGDESSMLCDECGQSKPSIFIRMEVDGQGREIRLCEACAAREGALDFPANLSAVLQSLAGHALGSDEDEEERRSEPVPQTVCRACGLTSSEFLQVERLGCEHCYEAHAPVLEPILQKIQGIRLRPSEDHRDYRPLVDVVHRLRAELAEAVHLERYDRAAAIRDKIRALEEKLNAIGDTFK